MESIRFPTREYFPIFEVPSTSPKTPFSSCPEKEVIIAIPNGRKSYLWLSNNGEDVCYSVPRNFKTQPEWTEVSTNLSTHSPKPFYGTLLYGTLVFLHHSTNPSSKNTEYFVADDLFYYSGISLTKAPFQERLEYLATFFNQFISTAPISTNLTSNKKKLTLVLANMRGIQEPSQKPLYKIHHWQLRNLSLVSPYFALETEPSPFSNTFSEPNLATENTQIIPSSLSPPLPPSNRSNKNEISQPQTQRPAKKEWIFQYHLPAYKQKAIFKIIPEEQCDIYSIYARLPTNHFHSQSHNSTKEIEWVSCNYAGIFEYNTSKLLNIHCRKIVTNLDQMEESDDEEDLPINPITPSEYYFECTFSNKFRKWVPMYFIPQCSPEKVISIHYLAVLKDSTKNTQPLIRKYK